MNTKNTAWVSENEKAHGANWRAWLGHLKDTPAHGLELGSWLGESAEWMLQNIFTHTHACYVCVDTFKGSEEHHLAGIDVGQIENDCRRRLAPFDDRVVIHVSESHSFLLSCGGIPRFDFVYVDAAHDAMNVLRDAVLAFELLAVGGVMIFDDYTWNVMPAQIDCPKMAIDSFVSCYGRQIEVIGMSYQLALRKVA